jgi:hypothetical protein
MSFWKTTQYTYQSFADLSLDRVILLMNALSRQDIIEWLTWNDRNGIYSDEQSLKELGNIMSKEEGMEIMLRHIEESQPLSV